METTAADKRRSPRVWFREAIGYLKIEENHFGGCLGVNLGEGGLRFYFSDFIPPDTEMLFNFPLSNQYLTGISGRVAWVQKLPHSEQYQVGVKFERNSANIQLLKQLQQYVESQLA